MFTILNAYHAQLTEKFISLNNGIIIAEKGNIIKNENNLVLSLVMKLPRLENPSITTKCNESTEIVALRETFIRSIDEHEIFVESRKMLLRNYFKKSSHIQKRSILAAIGNLVLTGFVTGITEIQLHQIKKHVDVNSKNILIMQKEIEGLNGAHRYCQGHDRSIRFRNRIHELLAVHGTIGNMVQN